MKSWFSSRGEALKIVGAWVGCLVIVCGVWLVSILGFLERARQAKTIRLMANRIRIHELQARRAEKDFLERSRLAEEFFRDGRSRYLWSHRAHVAALRREISTLGEHVSARRRPVIDRLLLLVNRYECGFQDLVAAYRERGFRSWGLEGELSATLARLRGALAEREHLAELLLLERLARNEQVLLRYRDPTAASGVVEDLNLLRERLAQPPSGSHSAGILRLVDEYAATYQEIRDLEARIGVTEELGLQREFREAIHAVEPVVEEIDADAVRADEEANETLMLGLLATCGIMGALLAMAIFFAQIAHLRSRRLLQVNEQMEEDHRRLLQSERLAAIGQMVTGLAHESRNTFQRTNACLDMLSQEVSDREEALRLVARIEESQDHLHHLYEQVREYAAPLKVHRESVSLNGVVVSAWERLDHVAAGRRVRFEENTSGLDLRVEVDSFALEQVFRNIFENCLAACADPVEIRVTYRECDLSARPALEVSVIDNGPGLDETQRQKIFEPFYTTRAKGTGLGMAIAKRLVEAHGGIIEVGAAPGAGAAIHVTLPRK